MDYEKKYNDALERAKKIHDEILNNELLGFPDQIREIFPELRESEDERIYNEIMEFFKMNEKRCIVDNSYTRWISWLEKQKESLHVPETCKENPDSFTDEQKPAWSEEDEKAYNNALDALYYKDCNDKDDLIRALGDLCHLITEKRKVIPPYAHWKPSKEQMEAFRIYLYNPQYIDNSEDIKIKLVESLYNDLKKLM